MSDFTDNCYILLQFIKMLPITNCNSFFLAVLSHVIITIVLQGSIHTYLPANPLHLITIRNNSIISSSLLAVKLRYSAEPLCCKFYLQSFVCFLLLKECEERELGAMRALRAHNRNKRDGDIPQEGATFCLCHKPPQPNMLTCSLCLDLFHSKCASPLITSCIYCSIIHM